MTSAPAFGREPEGNGGAERFIRARKENLFWLTPFETGKPCAWRGTSASVNTMRSGSSTGMATKPQPKCDRSNGVSWLRPHNVRSEGV
jgi:hypothetical protein